jgi:uncharacterized protein
MTAALLAGVVAASVAGSVHCLAMCGPLVGLHGGAKTTRLAVVHSLGRLTTYVALGALAGLLGSAVNLAGTLGNLQRTASIVAALVIVGIGIYPVLAAYAKRTRARKVYMQLNCISPDGAQGDETATEDGRREQVAVGTGLRLGLDRSARVAAGTSGQGGRRVAPHRHTPFTAALVRIRPKTAAQRSYLIGTLTGLIPCGWLWAFVIAGAGTGSALGGAATMFAFWLGTVPAMVGLLRVTGPVLARMRARMPAVTALALIVIGLGTLALRWRDAGTQQVETPHCHSHGAAS